MLHVSHWFCLSVGGPGSNWENEDKHNIDKTESLHMEVVVLIHEKKHVLLSTGFYRLTHIFLLPWS